MLKQWHELGDKPVDIQTCIHNLTLVCLYRFDCYYISLTHHSSLVTLDLT